MFKSKCWWNPRNNEIKPAVIKVSMRCSNCRKNDIYVDDMNTTSQYIISTFALITMLHHVYMLWIIKNHEQLKYNIDIQNPD